MSATIAIQKESQSLWERRAPLGIKHVEALVREGVKVIVQPSDKRSYTDQEYEKAGAVVSNDLSSADLIFGIKQPTLPEFLDEKTYCFFSHTIKAQPENMSMLDACLKKNIRLMDYEKLCDESGRRLVAFGHFAGMSGMVSILNGIGIRLMMLGYNTPFLHIAGPHHHSSVDQARKIIREAGIKIASGVMPAKLGPIVFVFTGSGNVSKGAQSMFKELPHEFVNVEDLPRICQKGRLDTLYACEVDAPDHLVRIEGGAFDFAEFTAFPDRYKSTFAQRVAPYASVIVNGIYWAPDSPRLITKEDAKALFARSEANSTQFGIPQRLIGICDISCDVGGSMEFMDTVTTIEQPFCVYDADSDRTSWDIKAPGVVMCSIDNMPAQFPSEATDFFGDLLFPHLSKLLKSDAKKKLDDEERKKLGQVVSGAIITSNGSLTPDFKYIDDLRKQK